MGLDCEAVKGRGESVLALGIGSGDDAEGGDGGSYKSRIIGVPCFLDFRDRGEGRILGWSRLCGLGGLSGVVPGARLL